MNILNRITRNPSDMAPANNTSANLLNSVQPNPLFNDLILQNIFSFCDYKTVKVCRRVCCLWNQQIGPMFIKNSALVLKDIRKQVVQLSECSSEVQSIIKRVNNAEIGISGFKIDLNIAKIVLEKLDINCLIHLELNNCCFYSASFEDAPMDYDYNSIDNLIGPNVKTLIVKSKVKCLSVSLKTLENISRIHLEFCLILANGEDFCKIAPKELTLVNIERNINGNILSAIKINEFVEFHRLDNLCVNNLEGSGISMQIVNLSDCVNLKSLALYYVTIILPEGISTSPRELTLGYNKFVNNRMVEFQEIILNDYFPSNHFDSLTLNQSNVILDFGLPISIGNLTMVCRRKIFNSNPEENPMLIKKLQIYGYFAYFLKVDLSLLPNSIEILHMRMRHSVICSRPVSFPNLRQLLIHGEIKCMPHFIKCPSLVDISLGEGHYIQGGQFTREVQQLPPNTQRIVICCAYGIVQCQPHHLQVLVISDNCTKRLTSQFQYPLSCSKITADLILLHYSNMDSGYYNYKTQVTLDSDEEKLFLTEENILNIMETKRNHFQSQNIAFGPVKWKNRLSFLKYRFSINIDQMAEYYLIQGENVKAVSRGQFSNWASFL